MSTGSETQSTQVQNRDPWAPAQPHMQNIMGGAQELHNLGLGSQTWGGALQSPLHSGLLRGVDTSTMMADAQAQTTSQPYNAAIQGVNSVNPTLGNIASGANSINTGGQFQEYAKQAGTQNQYANGILGNIAGSGDYNNTLGGVANNAGPTAADSYLTSMAQGGNTINPHIQGIADANAARIGNRIASQMSGAGRYGSFGHGDAMARSISEANNPMFAAAYESDRARQLQATGQIDAARLAQTGQRMTAAQGILGNQMNAANALGASNRADTQLGLGALTGLTGVEGQNIQNMGQAANDVQRNQQAWAQAAPALNELAYDPANRLMQTGGMLTSRDDQLLAAQRALFEQQQAMPWQQLARYQGSVTGFNPVIAGSGTQYTQGSQTKEPGLLDWINAGSGVMRGLG